VLNSSQITYFSKFSKKYQAKVYHLSHPCQLEKWIVYMFLIIVLGCYDSDSDMHEKSFSEHNSRAINLVNLGIFRHNEGAK